MFNTSDVIFATLRQYMIDHSFHFSEKVTETLTETTFMIMSSNNVANYVHKADRMAAMFVRRKGRRRKRYPISDKRAREIWNKYMSRFSPRTIVISAEGKILSVKSLAGAGGLS